MKKQKHKKISEQTESKIVYSATSENTCVCCGASIPEGTLVCIICKREFIAPNCLICNKPLVKEDSICQNCSDNLLHIRKKK